MTDQPAGLREEYAATIRHLLKPVPKPMTGQIGVYGAPTEYDLADALLAVHATRDAARQAAGQPAAERPMDRALRLGVTAIPDTITIEICEATNSGLPLPWPQFTEPDGELWWLTDETHDGDRVMLPAAGDMQPMLRRDVERFFGPLTRAGQPAVEQPAEAQPAEAHPPRERWRLEVWKDDRWTQPRPYSHDSVAVAEVHRAAWLNNRPGARTRLVRETTTWTVEETR